MSASSEQPSGERHLRVPDVSDQLGVHPRFVYRLAANREIGHVKVGKLLRFSQVDVDQYLARQRVEAVR